MDNLILELHTQLIEKEQKINELRYRIDKAIKYIEEAQEEDGDKESCSLYIPKLLEILKGE